MDNTNIVYKLIMTIVVFLKGILSWFTSFFTSSCSKPRTEYLLTATITDDHLLNNNEYLNETVQSVLSKNTDEPELLEYYIEGDQLEYIFSVDDGCDIISGFTVGLPVAFGGMSNIKVIPAGQTVRTNCISPSSIIENVADHSPIPPSADNVPLDCAPGYTKQGSDPEAHCSFTNDGTYTIINGSNCVKDCQVPGNSSEYLITPLNGSPIPLSDIPVNSPLWGSELSCNGGTSSGDITITPCGDSTEYTLSGCYPSCGRPLAEDSVGYSALPAEITRADIDSGIFGSLTCDVGYTGNPEIYPCSNGGPYSLVGCHSSEICRDEVEECFMFSVVGSSSDIDIESLMDPANIDRIENTINIQRDNGVAVTSAEMDAVELTLEGNPIQLPNNPGIYEAIFKILIPRDIIGDENPQYTLGGLLNAVVGGTVERTAVTRPQRTEERTAVTRPQRTEERTPETPVYANCGLLFDSPGFRCPPDKPEQGRRTLRRRAGDTEPINSDFCCR